jgi:ligand-binding sensor domain-containing protein/AraC-like DNA-binding protein
LKRKAFILLYFCISIVVQSQIKPIYPVQFRESKDFTGRVNCIFQDKSGFIWIGKESGLFRYDGNELKVYRFDPLNPKSIGSNNVRTIVEDARGDLLIGTKGGGLNHFHKDTESFTRYLHKKENPSSISFDEVETICPDGKGNFWVGTDGGGLNFLNLKTGKFLSFLSNPNSSKGLRSNSILHVYPNGKGKYWIATWGGGLHLFDPVSKQFKRIGEGTLYAKMNFFCVKEVKPGFLWIAAFNDGLIEYDIKKDRFSTVIEKGNIKYIQQIEVNAKGEVYVSSYNRLHYFKNANLKSSVESNREKEYLTISALLIDRNQNVWIGTENGLLGKISSFRRKFHQFSANLPFSSEYTTSIAADIASDNLYFVTSNKFFEYDLSSNTYKYNELPLSYSYNIIDVLPQEKLLIGSAESGILKLYDKKNGRISSVIIEKNQRALTVNNGVVSFYSDDSSEIWVSGNSSVYQIRPNLKYGNWNIENVLNRGGDNGISNSHFPTCILKHSNGDFWVGTWGGGVSRRLRGSTKFYNLMHDNDNKQSISNNFVYCMFADYKGHVWMGTQAGLNCFDIKTSAFKNISLKDGLADDYIFSIGSDKHNRIWVSTRHGISSISNDLKSIKNYDSKDGLPDAEFLPRAFAKDRNGNMYFGSKRGVVWFQPDSIKENWVLPKALIVNFKINDNDVAISSSSPLKQAIEYADEIRLTHKQNTFSFQLAALCFTNSKMNRIKFRLVGYDDSWQKAGTNQTAEYFDVPWGTYTFSVMAANEDGVWNHQVKSIKIVIGCPWWLSAWALILYFFVIVGLVLFYGYRYKQFRSTILSSITNAVLKRNKNRNLIQPSNLEIEPIDAMFLQKAVRVVEENMKDRNFGVELFCEKMEMTRHQLFSKIDSLAHVTLAEFIREVRLKRAAQLLLQHQLKVSEVASIAGINDPRYFRKCFKQRFGVAPAHYNIDNSENLPPN